MTLNSLCRAPQGQAWRQAALPIGETQQQQQQQQQQQVRCSTPASQGAVFRYQGSCIAFPLCLLATSIGGVSEHFFAVCSAQAFLSFFHDVFICLFAVCTISVHTFICKCVCVCVRVCVCVCCAEGNVTAPRLVSRKVSQCRVAGSKLLVHHTTPHHRLTGHSGVSTTTALLEWQPFASATLHLPSPHTNSLTHTHTRTRTRTRTHVKPSPSIPLLRPIPSRSCSIKNNASPPEHPILCCAWRFFSTQTTRFFGREEASHG